MDLHRVNKIVHVSHFAYMWGGPFLKIIKNFKTV